MKTDDELLADLTRESGRVPDEWLIDALRAHSPSPRGCGRGRAMSETPHDEMVTLRMPVWAFQGIARGLEKWAADHWDAVRVGDRHRRSHRMGGVT